MGEATVGSAHRENVGFASQRACSLARHGVGLHRPFARYGCPAPRSPVMFRYAAWVPAALDSQLRPSLKRHIPQCNLVQSQRPGPIEQKSIRPMGRVIFRCRLICVTVRCSRQLFRHALETDDPSSLPSGICPCRATISYHSSLAGRGSLTTESVLTQNATAIGLFRGASHCAASFSACKTEFAPIR